jgi:ribonuclease G
MSKEIYISSTPHETRLAIVEDDNLAEIYYERENEYTLAGSIYNGRVTRVLPGMQSSFVDIGLERDAFLYITDFMEEAGDAADFEAAHGGGDLRGGRSDAPKRERSDRGDRPAPLTLEGNAAPASERSDRPEEGRGERSGRGRNRRGRGDRDRGDRNGNADRNGSSERTASDRNGNAEAPRFADETVAPAPPAPPSDAAQLGEGAPGADGSRRWRGRRGRRRGRSSNGQPVETTPNAASSATPTEAEFTDFALEVEDAPEATESAAPVFAEPYTGEDEPARSAPPRTESANGQPREGRRDGGRGGRNDRGGRGGRNDRGDRNDRAPRVPRGFAPSLNLYGVDAPLAEGEVSETPDSPIILPGESLSKYRRSSESEPAQSSAPALPANVIIAKPTTVVEDFVATAWDGGAVLPGETLSRRNRPESRQDGRREPAAQHRSESQSNFRAPAPVATPNVTEHYEEVSVAAVAEEQLHPSESSHLDAPPAHETPHEAPSPFSQSVPVPLDPIAAVPEPQAPEAEYEPEEASASYRVDPVAPSEFRQSAPVFDEHVAEPEQEVVLHVDHSHPFNRLDEADTEIEATEPAAEKHTGAAHPDPLLELDTTGVPPPPPVFAQAESAVTASSVTEISPTGEMLSEPGSFAQSSEAEHDLTSPLHHESAVVSPEPQGYAPQSFAPGIGQLEEELIDEEEHESAASHTAYHEEFEDLEEETLEGAADLGTMIREMSIDEITRPGDAEAEDDFEEEEAEYIESDSDSDSDDTEEEELAGDGYVEGDKPSAQSAADAEFFANTFREPDTEGAADSEGRASRDTGTDRRPRRDGGRDNRRDGRRDGRDRDRNRSRSTGGESDRGRSGGGGRSRSMQATNLPAISDLLKPGQEILVQIAKEPIAKKGARITSHIALPGRFLVFMPTVNHTGVSRKIESDAERRRLKEILLSEKGEAAGGFIVRTAASGASEDELRSDLRFLLNLWTDIKNRSESSKSPALIYHDLNLVERILRDQVTDNFSAIWVDTESEYERVLRFLHRFQPQLIRRVKLYTKETPLFEQFGITEEINKALRSKVWLKSGGSIVINQTEALVAIDINTGKFVGKTARLEDTIVKTNLDAIPEIVRQIRLRDLGGIIIIDFIDMDERKNRNKVMAALEEELKNDRAPSKVLQFNDFGLVAITRKRVKQSLERTLSTTCGVCQGTGMTKSPITVCNDIYIEMRKMHKHLDRGDVMLRVHPEVVKQLKSGTSKWLQEMEEMVGKTILVKSDPSLHPEQFDIH